MLLPHVSLGIQKNKFPRIPCEFSTFVRDARKWRWVPCAPPLAKLIHATVVALMAEVKAEKPLESSPAAVFFRAYGHLCVKSTVISVLTIVLVQYEMVRCRLACLPYATLPGNSTPLKSNKYERSITPCWTRYCTVAVRFA